MLVAQAMLVWTPLSAEEVQDFIDTGHLGGGAAKPKSMPYSPAVLESVAKQWNGE